MKTLPEQARIVAGMVSLGERIAYGRDVELLMQLANQVEALTKERDALAADIRQMSDDLVAIEKLRREKDARMYADMHKLKEAAKLALDAMQTIRRIDDLEYGSIAKSGKAITALKEALK